MKKTRLITLATVASLALAGCGGGTETPTTSTSPTAPASTTAPAEPQEVTVWMYPVIGDEAKSREFWSGVETDFEAANKNIDLKIDLQPWANRDEKIATAIAAGTGPDLVLMTPDMLPQYEATGGLASLADAYDAADKDKFMPNAVKAGMVGDEIYAVPIYHTVVTTAYNKKVFADAGVELPTTWDEVKAAAPKLAANGVNIFDYSASPEVTLNLTFYPLLWQAGGSVFSEDGKTVTFNSPEGKAALQFLLELQAANGLPADAATKGNKVEGGGLTTGKTAMSTHISKAEAGIMITALGAENVEVGAPLKGVEQATFGLPGLLARTTISKDDAAAAAVAKFISSAEVTSELAKVSGYFPPRSDAAVDAADPLNEIFADALTYARPGEVNPKSRQVMAALVPHLQAALQGSKSVDQALADAEAEAQQLMAK